MRTVLVGPPPLEVEAWLERRRTHRPDVEELLIVDPQARTVEWFERAAGGFVPTTHSPLLGLTADELAAAITWPD